MAQLFPEEYLKNTLLVLEKHEVKLEFNDHHIPNFPVPNNQTVDEYFVSWVYRGAEERFGSNWRSKNEVVERLDYEVGVIKEMEFPNYFLIVADIVEWARQNNIMAGPGRGSAAGSLVSYCMKITEVNPLKYGLPFERFLIPGRKSLPDIDLDFDDRYREAVIQYTRNKYGFDHTAQIGTVSEIGAKTAIKDVARVLNYPYSVGDEINKAMPPALFGKTKTLDECLQSDEFLRLYETDEVAKEIIDIAKIFEGQWRQTGVHPAGLVIADKPLTEYIPLLQKGEGNPIITQWDMKRVDKLGLLKIDFLGLRNISMEVMAMENIKKTRGIEFKDPYLLIDEEDKQLYEALGNGDNVGVFQLESNGLLNLMVGMKPSSLEDIAALLALYRPGPMGSNFHNEYVERKHGRKPVKYLHPTLKPYLEGTYGLLIYQEQVLSIARFIAGFSVPDSDGLRKAMGKKIPAEMKKWHVQFVEGCINTSNMPRAIAEQLFTEIEHHADYSFSKNHAVAYAFTSYLTAYFKSKYPTEFLAAAMSSLGSETTNKQRLRLYLNECRKKGIIVAPPSIQKRNALFEVVKEDEIRYGFQSVKGFGEKGIELLGKDEKEYVNLFQFLREADNNYLDRGTVSSLIDAGCLDGFFSQLPIKRESLSRKQKIDTLYRESNTLGVFLSDHPFNNVQDLVAGRTTHNLLQLNDMSAQEKVKVAGIVVDVEKKITRAGKKMFNLLIEDSDSAIDVVVMPQIAAKMEEEPFAIGDVLIITGKTKREGDDENATVGLILFEVEKIDDSVLIGGSPILISTNNKLSLLQIQRMNDIIEKNKGNSPVFLSFRDGNLEVKMRFNALTTKEVESTLKILAEV
jgi:DNA polymerase-3 subunit alpha